MKTKTAPKKHKKVSTKVTSVNQFNVAGYIVLSLAVYLSVYYFLTTALKIVVPPLMNEALSYQIMLILTSLILATFMSFGVIMFLTRSTIHRLLKVMGIIALIASVIFLHFSLIAQIS